MLRDPDGYGEGHSPESIRVPGAWLVEALLKSAPLREPKETRAAPPTTRLIGYYSALDGL